MIIINHRHFHYYLNLVMYSLATSAGVTTLSAALYSSSTTCSGTPITVTEYSGLSSCTASTHMTVSYTIAMTGDFYSAGFTQA